MTPVPTVFDAYSQQGDICTVQLGRTVDAVLSLFHVISYRIANDAVRSVFARAAEHLRSGGLFVFDVWYSPAVCTQRPAVRVKRLEGDGIRVARIAEPQLLSYGITVGCDEIPPRVLLESPA